MSISASHSGDPSRSGRFGLQDLPKELLLSILDLLDRPHLVALNQTNSWFYDISLPLIWRNIELVDQSTDHGDGGVDEHDDTPLLRLLLTFVK
jgi:hypothetical protein